MDPTFIGIEVAAKLVGVTRPTFTRLYKLAGLIPVMFPKSGNYVMKFRHAEVLAGIDKLRSFLTARAPIGHSRPRMTGN